MESLSLSPADRLRMLETNSNLLRERVSLLAQNLVDAHRQQYAQSKFLEQEIKELKTQTTELKLTLNHLIQELSQCARKDQLKTIEKYLSLWNPINFITQKELEAAIREIAAKHTEESTKQRSETKEHQKKAQKEKRGVHHRNPAKAKTHAK